MILISFLVLLIQSAEIPDVQVRRAASLLQAGKHAEADQMLSALLKQSPSNAQALNLLGILRGEQERLQEAEALFNRALDANPRLSGAAINLGYLYRKMQRPLEALTAFQKAAKLHPADPEVRYNIASLRVQTGEFAAALSLLSEIPEGDRPPDYPIVEARCLLGLGRSEELRSKFAGASAALRRFPPLLADYAQILLQARMAAEAAGVLEAGPSDSFPAAFTLGEAYQMSGENEKARAAYRRALEIQPQSVETLKRLSLLAQRVGDWQEMLDLLGKARVLAPNSGSILYGYAVAALRTSHLADAQHAVQQALNLEPDNPDYLYLYGVTQMLTFPDLPKAAETLERYVKLRPDDPNGHLAVGSVYYQSAQYDPALEALRRCRSLRPDLVEPLYYMGMIALNQGELEAAVSRLGEVIAAEPRHAAAHAGLGSAYFKLGDLARARQSLERAIEINPDQATPHYQLSQVLVRLNETGRAQEELRLYTSLKAKAEEAREAASRLLGVRP